MRTLLNKYLLLVVASYVGLAPIRANAGEFTNLLSELSKPRAEALEKQLEQAKAAHQAGNVAVQAAKAKIAELKPEMDEIAKAIRAQEKAVLDAETRGALDFYSSEPAAKLKAKAKLLELRGDLAAQQETVDKLNAEVKTASSAAEKARAASDQATVGKNSIPGEVEKALSLLNKKILEQGLQANLNDVLTAIQSKQLDLSKMDTKLQILEMAYDNKAIGGYLKSKMERLVNSPAFCEAQKSCPVGGNKIKLDSIFHDERGNLRNHKASEGPSADTHE